MCSPVIDLLKHLCGTDTQALDWVLNWLAIPLQNLGTKMDTALIVHGHIQGAGKSLFFDRIMRRIYEQYKLMLGQGQLDSQYNDWVEGKLFCVFEEILQGKERYSQMGMIKQLITGDTVYINKNSSAAGRKITSSIPCFCPTTCSLYRLMRMTVVMWCYIPPAKSPRTFRHR